MTENQFVLGFWSEDLQHSVVSCRDIIGEVQVNDTVPVAWRVKKKGGAATNWHEG